MTSVQRFLSGHANHVRTAAALAASSVKPSTAIERIGATRAGGGRVRLQGAYTGHEAAGIDVEIVAAGGVPRASVPTFAGVGNGQLAVLDVDGAAALQALTFTLRDLGVKTQHARLDVREVVIRAKAPGVAGNSVRITVTPALTRAGTAYALLAEWQAGTRTQLGEQWDFGGLPVSASGELDPASPRVQFGFDPTVYRAFREYKDGAWRHGLSPVLERAVPAGTRVWSVTGGYTVTVTDGTDTETYVDIVTFFDLLAALAASAMVEVAGVVAADRRVGGQAAIDVPLRTSAWLFAMSGKVKLDQVGVPAAAPTQALTIRCINSDVVGAERWSVNGAVSGELATAVTGQLYTSAAANFLVPTITPAEADAGEWSFKYEPVSREESEGVPSVCVRPFKFGRNARARSVTFRYQKRPPADCKCSNMPTPRLSLKCLGLTTGEEAMALDTEYHTRLVELYEWQHGFVSGNVDFADPVDRKSRVLADEVDIQVAKGSVGILAEALAEIYATPLAAAQWDDYFTQLQDELEAFSGRRESASRSGRQSVAWAAETTVNVGQFIRPTTPNGNLYLVIGEGTFSSTEPDWGGASNPVTDGTAQLEILPPYWSATTAVSEGDIVEPGNGYRYRATTAGTTAATEPYWPQGATDVTDGSVTWSATVVSSGQEIVSLEVYGGRSQPQVITPATVEIFDIDNGEGVSPRYMSRAVVMDGPSAGKVITHSSPTSVSAARAYAEVSAAGWRRVFGTVDVSQSTTLHRQRIAAAIAEVEPYYDRYRTAMDHVRTLAGIVPKSSASSDAGDCWRDYVEEAYWWVDTAGFYLPAFNNKGYISARRNTETGKPYSTQEFGFGLVVACPERLKEGDTLNINILTVDAQRPYQVGDEAVLETVAAGPAWLGGGVDGTDELTWSVFGSDTGVLPDYVVPLSGTAPVYAEAGIEARMALGGIPFALGDAFSFSVEAGQFRWRRDAEAWSDAADIPATGVAALADGVSAVFEAGAAPSFVPDDVFSFSVHQPNAVSHVRDAHDTAWAWAGDTATLEIDFGALRSVSSVALARYWFPAGAAVQAALSADGVAWSDAIALDVTRPVAVAMLTAQGARYVRLSVTDGAGGSIGWVWAGMPVATRYHATTCEPSRRYAVSRGGGLNPAGLYAGRGIGWDVAWDAILSDGDVGRLIEVVDWMQVEDEPIIFVPHYLHAHDAALVRAGSDALDLPDFHAYQPNSVGHRQLSASLTLEPVLA